MIYTKHFKQELANDNLTRSDILTVCRSGVIINEPELDARTGNWKYRIEGLNDDADRSAVVFTFVQATKAVLITVFRTL